MPKQGGGKDAGAAAAGLPLVVVAAIIPRAFTAAALPPDAGAGGVGGAFRIPVIVPECGIGQGGANQPGVEGIIDDAVVQDGYGHREAARASGSLESLMTPLCRMATGRP